MDIRWFGHSFFEITTSTEVKKGIKIYLDPFGEEVGLKLPKLEEADVVTVSHDHFDHNNVGIFKNSVLALYTPGEYSVKGVDIKGFLSYHDKKKGAEKGINVIFAVESEGIRVVHLGDLNHELGEEEVKKIDGVDVLLVPVGGPFSLRGKESIRVIKQLEPKIVVPMHYKLPQTKLDLAPLDEFCKEIGVCPVEPIAKLSVKLGTLEGKEMEIVIMRNY
ncbi:MAG: MBL fold metallo-hydrolase [Candidatus Moranbacteria bacterium]|nr:MBL fold metallo-hydrolase [Candidatus Moranbacteria bacterium]